MRLRPFALTPDHAVHVLAHANAIQGRPPLGLPENLNDPKRR